jgi:hypothetical protein
LLFRQVPLLVRDRSPLLLVGLQFPLDRLERNYRPSILRKIPWLHLRLAAQHRRGTPATPADVPTEDSFAFGFGIDGVLIRGGRPIPEAIEAIKVLNGDNEYGVKV